MKKTLPIILIFGACAFRAWAAAPPELLAKKETPKAEAPAEEPLTSPSLMDQAFVVETDESDLDAGLERIAGDIDRGIAEEDYTYKSSSHYGAGPFDRVRQYDSE
jgi:hypothetical protein